MNQNILCTWLGLKDESWPPDPYALLGVDPAETNLGLVEQCVHDRLARLRCYQNSHPEEATEGMNRLAQAFIQVTEALSRAKTKKAAVTVAVAQLPCGNGGKAANPGANTSWPTTKKREAGVDDTAVGLKTGIDWRNTPPPVRAPETATPQAKTDGVEDLSIRSMQEGCATEGVPDEPAPTFTPAALPAAPAVLPDELAIHLAHHSAEALRGLRTLPTFLERAAQTRQLMQAWKYAGKYLGQPKRRIEKAAAAKDLAQRMDRVFELMEDYPAFIGHPGKPGYRVMAIARLEATTHMFRVLDQEQREELALDWEAGTKVLWQHHRFLLRQIKQLRRRGVLDKGAGAVEAFVRDHKRWFTLATVAFVALLLYVLFAL
jgi:hypothetical protein